jgi:hypothetical protein
LTSSERYNGPNHRRQLQCRKYCSVRTSSARWAQISANAVGWAVNVNWRSRWHRSACACMGGRGSASLGCVAGPLPRAPSVCRAPARVIATVPKMEAKTAKWLENKCLHMCRASTLCRHLRRVKIEPTKPPSTGPNWQVAGFDPPLGENSPAYREAMRIINRIRVTYALARAKK